MKKLNFLVAGALMMAGIHANAQIEDQLFFYGFEDNMAAFNDSSAAVDTLTYIQYYNRTGSNGASTINYTAAEWQKMEPIDTVIPLFHGLAPLSGDSWELVYDETGTHAKDFAKLGGQGGDYYFHYTSAAGRADCEAYNADIFVRGIPTEDFTSYRVVWYQKAIGDDKRMQVEVMRGYYNSEKAYSMNGDGSEFLYDTDSEGNAMSDQWERVTFMTFFQNDSVANHYMYKGGYWWSDSWKIVIGQDEDGNDIVRNSIVQPKTSFLRMSFRGGSTEYFLDDIALYKSWIGGAEYNGEIIRIDFGYQTNLADLAKTDPVGIIDAPFENLTVTGVEAGERYEIFPVAAEYHDDGYMYIWLEESAESFEDIRISYKNPVDDPTVALKYTGSRYPKALDSEWVEAGKYVPDFEDEFVLYNAGVSAVNREYTPPTLLEVSPENNSFNLDASKDRTVTAKFNKSVYIDDAKGVMAFIPYNDENHYLTLESYDEDTYTVTFSFPESLPTTLKGDIELYITNAKALEEGSPAEQSIINLTYGAPADDNESIVAFNKAYADAVAKQTEARESEQIYAADMQAYDAMIANYNGWWHTAPSVYAAAVTEMENAIKSIDSRISLANSFQKLIDDSEIAFDSYKSMSDRAEYKATQDVYNKYHELVLTATSTEDLQAIVDEYNAIYSKLNAVITGIQLRTKQINGLVKLSQELGVDFGADAETVAAITKENIEDNQNLAEVYKLALKARMSEILAEADSSFDATNFIQNSGFYAEYDATMASDRYKVHHWQDKQIFPGWTVLGGSGNDYINNNTSSLIVTAESPVKDARIGLDWNSNCRMTQTLTALPAGNYGLTINIAESWGTLSSSNHYGDLIFTQMNGDEIVAVDTLSYSTVAVKQAEIVDTIVTINAEKVVLDFTFGTTGCWTFTDNIGLKLVSKIADHDYATDAAAAKAAMSEVLTVVEPVAGAAVEAEYFNLNGQRVAAPQRGISIKVSTDAKGNRKAEKVLVR